MILNQENLQKVLRYDAETGKLFWIKRSAETFPRKSRSSQWTANVWNKNFAGKEAFTATSRGYRVGEVFGRRCLAHRLIWLMQNGNWPAGDIDHINGNRSDNRIKNLRDVSRQENQRNCAISKNNTSGVLGVAWDATNKKWRAKIKINGKTICLGRFKEIEAAKAARIKSEIENGFHDNHGRNSGMAD